MNGITYQYLKNLEASSLQIKTRLYQYRFNRMQGEVSCVKVRRSPQH